ncbi:MAG: hypothetical protein ABIH86_07470 [Planctomycetota bacterium]
MMKPMRLNSVLCATAICVVASSAIAASGKYMPFDDLYGADVKTAIAEGGDRLSVVAQSLLDAMTVNSSDSEMLDALLINALRLYLLSDKPDDLGALMRVALQKTKEYPSMDLPAVWKRLGGDIDSRLRRERNAERRFTLCFVLGLMDLELSRACWFRSDAATAAAFRTSARNHAKNTQNPVLNDLSVSDGDFARDYIKKYAPALNGSADSKTYREAAERFLFDEGALFRHWYDGSGADPNRPVTPDNAFRFILKHLILPAQPFMAKSADTDMAGFAAFCELLADPAFFNAPDVSTTTVVGSNALTEIDRIAQNWRKLPTHDLVCFIDFFKRISEKADPQSALKPLYKTALANLLHCILDRHPSGGVDGIDFPAYFRASQMLDADLAQPRPFLCSGALWSAMFAPGVLPFRPSAGVNPLELPLDNFEIEFRFTPALTGDTNPIVHTINVGDVGIRFQRTVAGHRPDFFLTQGGKTIVTKEMANYQSDVENSRLTIRCIKGRMTVAFENAPFADNVHVTVRPPKAPDDTTAPTPRLSWNLGASINPISVFIRSFDGVKLMER